MKKQITLFFLMAFLLPLTVVRAQAPAGSDTVRTLIFTEVRYIGNNSHNYVELTNVGEDPLEIREKEFKFAKIIRHFDWGSNNGYRVDTWVWLPPMTLQPGESWVVARINDYARFEGRTDKAYPPFDTHLSWPVLVTKRDLPVRKVEVDQDLVTGYWEDFGEELTPGEFPDELNDRYNFRWGGVLQGPLGHDTVDYHHGLLNNRANVENSQLVLEYHVMNAEGNVDSTLVDALLMQGRKGTQGRSSVAGVPRAAFKNHLLIRKTNVTQGSTDWEEARGVTPEDAEWLPIRFRNNWRDPNKQYFTTVDVHESALPLEESDFTPKEGSGISMDWDSDPGVITIPWGINKDYLLNHFDIGPNIVWEYDWSPLRSDSLHNLVSVNDTLTVIAMGDGWDKKVFTFEIGDVPEDIATVIPGNRYTGEPRIHNYRIYEEGAGYNDVWEYVPGSQYETPFYVTEGANEIDTIGNLPYALRVDTLIRYIDMAPGATWEIQWVDETERVDLKNGDILTVTAPDGSTTKDYFLKAEEEPLPSHNAQLSAITWPEVPTFLSNSPDWNQDTIPSFNPARLQYTVTLPPTWNSIPALVPITMDLNAQVQVDRATQLVGKYEDRVTTFTVVAEDDTSIIEYNIEFKKQKYPEDIEPFAAEPIITGIIGPRVNGANFVQITNPGTEPIDLSNYMIAKRHSKNQSLAEVIQWQTVYDPDGYNSGAAYNRFVPGYMYYHDSLWDQGYAGKLQKDLLTDPLIGQGESFVVGSTFGTNLSRNLENNSLMDVNLLIVQAFYDQLVGADVPNRIIYTNGSVTIITRHWNKHFAWFLLKIKNDSVTAGGQDLKPIKAVGDPDDYELIDMWGDYSGDTRWYVQGDTGASNGEAYFRKPEFWQPDSLPAYAGSWGPTPEESEWEHYTQQDVIMPKIGNHTFDPIFVYRSTVLSYLYDVSRGYGIEEISGIPEGTTVDDFKANIIKQHEGQILEVMGKGGGDNVTTDDTLMITVTEASIDNMTKYALKVGEPLSSEASLTAKSGSGYTVEEGAVSGIPFGASIEEVLGNVTASAGATIHVINDDGMPMPMQIRNVAGEYVKTAASSAIIFEVVSENNQTTNTYQLMIDASDNEAILVSDVYDVDQEAKLVSNVPEGINVRSLMSKISVNVGASVLLENKIGIVREDGLVAQDDRLVVTSPSGDVTKRYFINTLEENPSTEAYVVSDVYDVNQAEFVISGVNGATDAAIFRGLLTAAPRANMVVVDADSNVVTSGEITKEHQVIVTSGNKSVVRAYALDVDEVISIQDVEMTEISVYPNPARNHVVVNGLKTNSQVVVRDITGHVVKRVHNNNNLRVNISLEDLPAGIYLLNAEKGNVRSNTVKFIKQ